MIQSSQYLTEPKQRNYSEKMDVYIDGLDKKIASAKWKQTLILNYNYLPLQMVKQKIQLQTKSYGKKLNDLQAKMVKQTHSQEILSQVDTFKQFANKLQYRIKEIQQNIQLVTMNITILKASVQDKRKSLVNLIKQNASFSKFIIDQKQKTKSINLKTKRRQNIPVSGYKSEKKKRETNLQAALSQKQKQTSTQTRQQKHQSNITMNTHQIYEQCVQAIVKSLRTMNATDDVQTGIYLQIMNRKIPTKAPVFSLKSKTCDVLMDRYKDLRLKKNTKTGEDFSMRLQTFLGLNWKQIMGIVLVKDRNASKLKNLIKGFQFSI